MGSVQALSLSHAAAKLPLPSTLKSSEQDLLPLRGEKNSNILHKVNLETMGFQVQLKTGVLQ